MPCYDGRDNERTEVIYQSGISPDELARARDNAAKMIGVVCAIFNELERRGIGEAVIAEASRNGLIDIMGIWNEHKKDDASRLAKDLHHRYSKDEQAILRALLNTGNES